MRTVVDRTLTVGPVHFKRESQNGATREEETCVEPGDRVHVIGRLCALGSRPSAPEAAGASMALRGPAAPCAIITDRAMTCLEDTLQLRVGALALSVLALLALGAALTRARSGAQPRPRNLLQMQLRLALPYRRPASRRR